MSTIRAFIAVELPPALKRSIAGVREELKSKVRTGAGISWTRPETIHLTLRFLGDIEAGAAEEAAAELAGAAGGLAPFEVTAAGVGGFPSPESPRVAWVGMEPSPELSLLREKIEDALERTGLERDPRGFSPHLTFARARDNRARKALAAGLKDLETEVRSSFTVDGFALFKSELGPGGAEHTVLATIELKG